jgi:UDP-N-acetylglucosamine diphosphorylase / glucose-1-phosphate thymidylyltransferase / UDP-N-acetylgalactosamine diphosphorylase / glucosamine-1-phosphate N-acetyltransferase / galactosamine-1-phosphate N-acetyltransferase
MQAIILAAGRGKRLNELTEEIPKVLMPVNGKSTIEIILKQLSETGIKEAVIIVNYKKEKIIEKLGNEIYGIKIKYAEQKETNGTATAVLAAEPHIKSEKFFVIAGDSIFPTEILKKIKQKISDGVMAVCKVNNPSSFGVIETENQCIKKIIEKSQNPPTNLANTSIYYLPKEIFDACSRVPLSKRGEYELTEAIQLLIDNGKKIEYEIIENWIDIGTKKQLEEAQQLIKELF